MKSQNSLMFPSIHRPGSIFTPIIAKVYQIEEKCLQSTATPYLRITLTQDLGKTLITALSIGKSYQEAKNLEVGEEYVFGPGSFRAKERESGFETWSNFGFDLWFDFIRETRITHKKESSVNRSQSFYEDGRADLDDDWRAR